MNRVIASSALLALILEEPGGPVVEEALRDTAIMSAVNVSEVIARLVDLTDSEERAFNLIQPFRFETLAFDEDSARRAGLLRRSTRTLGLSFGDRACLALAQRLGMPALTADRAWITLDIGVEVILCR